MIVQRIKSCGRKELKRTTIGASSKYNSKSMYNPHGQYHSYPRKWTNTFWINRTWNANLLSTQISAESTYFLNLQNTWNVDHCGKAPFLKKSYQKRETSRHHSQTETWKDESFGGFRQSRKNNSSGELFVGIIFLIWIVLTNTIPTSFSVYRFAEDMKYVVSKKAELIVSSFRNAFQLFGCFHRLLFVKVHGPIGSIELVYLPTWKPSKSTIQIHVGIYQYTVRLMDLMGDPPPIFFSSQLRVLLLAFLEVPPRSYHRMWPSCYDLLGFRGEELGANHGSQEGVEELQDFHLNALAA